MNNDGLKFQHQFAVYMQTLGYWVYEFPTKHAGQPADLICVKGGRAFLLDTKTCEGIRFPLERIEDNQIMAMRAWREAGNGEAYFIVRTGDGIWLVTYSRISALISRHRFKSISLSTLLLGAERLMSKEKWDEIQNSQ